MDYQIDRLKGENSKKGACDDIGEMFMRKAKEMKEENEQLQDCRTIVAELGEYVEYIDKNACDVYNKLTEKYRSEFDPAFAHEEGLTMEEKDAIVAKLSSNRAS